MALSSRRGSSSSKRGSFRAKVVHNSQQQRRKESNYGHLLLSRGVSVFKEEAGSGRINLDILPYFVTDERHPDRDDERDVACVGGLWYKRPYKLHRISDGSNFTTVVCPTSVGRKCPICEYRSKRLSEDAKWDDEEIKSMRPSDRNLYYVVPRGSRKFEEKPYLWDISQFCFEKELINEIEENDEFGDFPDLEKGLTLSIRFSEEKVKNSSFVKASNIKFEERDYTYPEDVVKALPSLDEVLDIKDYREVDRLYFDTDGEDEGDDASETRPRGREEVHREQTRTDAPSAAAGQQDDKKVPAERSVLTRPRDQEVSVPRETEKDQRPRDERKPARDERKPTRDKAASPTNGVADECPSGYQFGVDVDSKAECEDCPVWSECMDAKAVG